jgi:hypothetical protein
MESEPTYTVEEARALLPQVRATLLQLAVERQRADASHAELHRRLREGHDPTDPEEQAAFEARAAEERAMVRVLLDHLESLGVVVRDLDEGLVDIPTVRDGEPAWLCWRLSDPELAFWHSTREGYTSRRPL